MRALPGQPRLLDHHLVAPVESHHAQFDCDSGEQHALIDEQEIEVPAPTVADRRGPSRKYPWAILVVVVLFVVLPFLSWYGSWFGRKLSDNQMQAYLHDQVKPRNVQHALSQIGNRIIEGDPSVKRWYAEVIAAAQHSSPEVRLLAAWVMGQDNHDQGFHAALVPLLEDAHPGVRHNAALALVRFNDSAARPELVAMLKPTTLRADADGTAEFIVKDEGTSVAANAPLARIKQSNGQILVVHAPEAGRIETLAVADGVAVSANSDLVTLAPETEQVFSALVALYVMGQPDDIPYIQRYTGPLPGVSDRINKQAVSTLAAIRERAQKRTMNGQ